MKNIIVGIDYSLTCPCMCVSDSSDFFGSKFYYLTSVKKNVGVFLNKTITGCLHEEYDSQEERHDNISDFFIKRIPERFVESDVSPRIIIEDYSFGSKGRVFNLAENMGLLKYKFWKYDMNFELVPPTVLKKFATGKGNAKKEDMYKKFVKETGVDLQEILFPGRKLGNPVTDIVDSYYLMKWGFSQ